MPLGSKKKILQVLAAYVLPDHHKVYSVTSNALRRPKECDTLKAFYNRLRTHYQFECSSPITPNHGGFQLIKTPDELFHDFTITGTCLDIAIFAAACMKHLELNPVLAIIYDKNGRAAHALSGCWITSPYPGQILKNKTIINEIRAKHLLLVDWTVLQDKDKKNFDQAIEDVGKRLSNGSKAEALNLVEVREIQPVSAATDITIDARVQSIRAQLPKRLVSLPNKNKISNFLVDAHRPGYPAPWVFYKWRVNKQYRLHVVDLCMLSVVKRLQSLGYRPLIVVIDSISRTDQMKEEERVRCKLGLSSLIQSITGELPQYYSDMLPLPKACTKWVQHHNITDAKKIIENSRHTHGKKGKKQELNILTYITWKLYNLQQPFMIKLTWQKHKAFTKAYNEIYGDHTFIMATKTIDIGNRGAKKFPLYFQPPDHQDLKNYLTQKKTSSKRCS